MAMAMDIGFSFFAAVAAIILLFLSNPAYSFAFFYLVLNAYFDKRKRDIPSYVVFSFIVPAIALIIMLIYSGLFSPYGYAVSLAATFTLFASSYALHRKRLLGEADPWIILGVGLLTPYFYRIEILGFTLPLPAIMATMLLMIVPIAISIIANIAHNIGRIRDLAMLEDNAASKIYHIIFSRISREDGKVYAASSIQPMAFSMLIAYILAPAVLLTLYPECLSLTP
jgi:hypothetical protein